MKDEPDMLVIQFILLSFYLLFYLSIFIHGSEFGCLISRDTCIQDFMNISIHDLIKLL